MHYLVYYRTTAPIYIPYIFVFIKYIRVSLLSNLVLICPGIFLMKSVSVFTNIVALIV
jgi:hypothetical protein